MKSIYDNTFEHHGILGQKWGVKNGPPYPLDENSGSNSSGKHGGDKKKSGSSGSSGSNSSGKHESDNKSGSSGKHRLLSLFRKRDKNQNETKENKKNDIKKNQQDAIASLKMLNVFRNVFQCDTDAEAADITARYLERANYDRQLALNLLRWDMNEAIKTHKWVEHEPKELPRSYRSVKDAWLG